MNIRVSVDQIPFKSAMQQKRVLASALKTFNGIFRHKVAQRFAEQGPGWPQKKDVSDAQTQRRDHQVRSLAEHRLRRKLERDLRRAQQRMGRGKGTMQSVQRRAAVLKEFERQMAGGQVGAGKKLKQGSKEQAIAALSGGLVASKGMQKSVAGIRDRMARAESAAAARLLGKMASSIKSKVGRGELVVSSSVAWAGVHNEGGQAGKGAHIPARPFLFVENEDTDILAEIILNRAIAALEGS